MTVALVIIKLLVFCELFVIAAWGGWRLFKNGDYQLPASVSFLAALAGVCLTIASFLG
jgi:hypothetical protein